MIDSTRSERSDLADSLGKLADDLMPGGSMVGDRRIITLCRRGSTAIRALEADNARLARELAECQAALASARDRNALSRRLIAEERAESERLRGGMAET